MSFSLQHEQTSLCASLNGASTWRI